MSRSEFSVLSSATGVGCHGFTFISRKLRGGYRALILLRSGLGHLSGVLLDAQPLVRLVLLLRPSVECFCCLALSVPHTRAGFRARMATFKLGIVFRYM